MARKVPGRELPHHPQAALPFRAAPGAQGCPASHRAVLLPADEAGCRTEDEERHSSVAKTRFGRDPKRLAQKSVRSYILHLKEDRGWAPSSLRQAIAACRMYYGEMLGKSWKLWDVVRVRDRKRLPVVLEIDEVGAVLGQVSLLRHRTPLRLIYCCGLRLDEATRLTVDDVEPGRLRIRDGIRLRNRVPIDCYGETDEGGKERFVPLPELMLRKLRRYWKRRRNPKWIFPTPGRGLCSDARERMGRSDLPIGKGSLQKAFHDALRASGLRKKATIHTLRHSYATHLLAMGVNIRQLQLYLGHEDIETTTICLHLIPFGEERSMKHVDAIAERTL